LKDTTTGISELGNVLMYSRAENTFYFNRTIDRINVVDLDGRTVLTFSNVDEMNLSKLYNGIYVLKSQIADVNCTTKVIKY
jgi:hypothetical protein